MGQKLVDTGLCVGGFWDGFRLLEPPKPHHSSVALAHQVSDTAVPPDTSGPRQETAQIERTTYMKQAVAAGDTAYCLWLKDGMNAADAIFELIVGYRSPRSSRTAITLEDLTELVTKEHQKWACYPGKEMSVASHALASLMLEVSRHVNNLAVPGE